MARIKAHKLKFVNTIRWFVSVFILLILLWLLYIYAGRALCHIALGQIAELTNTKIKVGSVDFHTNGSVFIEDLVISPRKSPYENATIINAKKVYTRFSLGSLLLLRPRLQVIDVDDFVFRAQYDLDTGWSNLSSLQINPPEDSYSKMPRINLSAGRLQYSKILNGQEEVAISIPLNASFEPEGEKQEGYIFEIKTATMASGYGTSRLTGSWKPGLVIFTGGISSLDVPELEMAWIIDVLAAELRYSREKDFSLKLRIKDLQSKRSESLERLALVGPPFLKKSGLFTALQRFFDRYQPLGRVDIELETAGNLNLLGESTLDGYVDCKDVEFFYSGFQYGIDNLVGRMDFTKNSLELNNLTARHGDVVLFFNGWTRDFGPERQYRIRITSDNMPLDDDLYKALNTEQKKFWDYFSPVGQAAVDLQLSRQSPVDKQMNLSLELNNVEAIYRNFPYPLKNMTGEISFTHDDVVFSDVVSHENERKITLNGRIETDGPTYDVSVDVNNIPLDSELEEVLPERQKNLYQKLCPSGFADGRIRFFTGNNEPVNYTADLSFRRASLYFEKLPLPVSDISARAVFTADSIDVNSFSGLYGESPLHMTGRIRPDLEQQQALYDISLSLEQMQLKDDFFNLLPVSLREKVIGLKPDGKVDLNVDLNKNNLSEPPLYRITVDCLGNNITLPNFPNSLKDINGTLIIEPNSVQLDDVVVSVGDVNSTGEDIVTIKLNGDMTLDNGNISEAFLHLGANDINFDRRLAQFLPQQAEIFSDKLLPSGSFDLDLTDIRIEFGEDGQKSIDFAGVVVLHKCELNVSGAEVQLDIELRAKGLYRTGEGLCSFRTTIDEGLLKVQGKSLNDLNACIIYDPNQRTWSTEDFVSGCYSGKTMGKFTFLESTDGLLEYILQVAFDNVDLKQYLSDVQDEEIHENTYTSGKMSGSLSINTHITGQSSRIGSLRLRIKDMQVGKLSPLGKLLQVLNLTEPKDYAFDRMFVDSYIKGNGLFVEKLDLSGHGIAFYGSGWLGLVTRSVNLKLTARGKRLATDDPSILQSLTEGLGQAVVRLEVTGNFDDPVITTKALPVIEETLQILGTKPKTPD